MTIALLFAAGTTLAGSATPGDPARGQVLYQAQCGGCHSIDANRIGPAHRGVVGDKIASAPGYAYSPAIKRLNGTWTPLRLDQWLQGPQKVAPGSKMFLTVNNPQDRRDIIAYLASNPLRTPRKAR